MHEASSDLPFQPSLDELQLLLARVARGDRLAFKSLYTKTSGRLFGIVKRIVRNHALAEEVLQEVYVRIWERASSYDAAVGAPSAWLTVIARNRAIDVTRQRGERPASVVHDDGEKLLLRLSAPTDGLDLADRDQLKRCLAELDEPLRRCILLAYCIGYSREELAVRFDRPVNSVKTWLHRGLASLRACFEAV